MAVVDVKLMTGFSVIEASLKKLRVDKNLNFKRYDIDAQNVQLYLDEVCQKVVKVYDYYEPVTRMTSRNGHLMVIKAFSRDTKKKRKKIMKKELEYRVSDFCPCDEIYEGERSIVIGGNSYFKDTEGEKIIMKPAMKKMMKMLKNC
ncbi:uncharacterized protein LOC124453877 [Xenia sp. Carnegie-2017]|uniref:uncharacterized protein LOC124453877 n=1 Tax=Xenia sp. Carnegie-2017 TaxID=2897299 RepID=UPI001F03B86D|nr:uncharacterized protein LOC124453877 [Xenia sp. Carnegie-2017]